LGVAPVTFTEIVQVAPAATDPVATATAVPPATAVTTPAPQVLDAVGVAAMKIPDGSVSEMARLLRADAETPVFATVIVKVETPFDAIVVGENAFVSVTLVAFPTLSVAVAGAVLVMPSVDVSALAGIVLR
jgi:hypothetical protein